MEDLRKERYTPALNIKINLNNRRDQESSVSQWKPEEPSAMRIRGDETPEEDEEREGQEKGRRDMIDMMVDRFGNEEEPTSNIGAGANLNDSHIQTDRMFDHFFPTGSAC